jgi:hypothetical protein
MAEWMNWPAMLCACANRGSFIASLVTTAVFSSSTTRTIVCDSARACEAEAPRTSRVATGTRSASVLSRSRIT